MIVVPVILGAVAFVLACVNQRRLWMATQGWRYRDPAAVEPSDAAMVLSRIGFVVAGILLIVVPLAVRAGDNHDRKAAAHAAVSASAAQARGEAQAQQLQAGQKADLQKEGTRVLSAIIEHTPKGKSPRTVPLSQLPTWLPELGSAQYQVTPDTSYATAGRLTVGSVTNDPLAPALCVTVPDHTITSDQIASGSYVGTC